MIIKFFQQAQTKTKETFELQLRKSKKVLSSNWTLEIGNGEWMLRLTSWKVYNSNLKLTDEIITS